MKAFIKYHIHTNRVSLSFDCDMYVINYEKGQWFTFQGENLVEAENKALDMVTRLEAKFSEKITVEYRG